MIELHINPDMSGPVTEYFCCSCRQLRLSWIADKTTCRNCGGKDLITGPVESLDKEALIRKLDGHKG